MCSSDLSFELLESSLMKELGKKPALLETNIRCAKAGFDFEIEGSESFKQNAKHSDEGILHFAQNDSIGWC